MATILTKRSNTASSVPVAGDLTNSTGGAELAVNTADKRLFTKDSGGTVVELGTNPSSITLASGTANAVPYLNGSKVLTSGSALTFDGTNLGVGAAANSYGAGYTVVGSYGSSAGFFQATSGTVIAEIAGVSGDGTAQFGSRSNHPVTFKLNNSEQMRLTSTGLGIGTSSPAVRLHVESASATTNTKVVSTLSGSLFYSGFEVARTTVAAGALMRSARNASTGGVGWEWLTTADNNAEISGSYTSRMILDNVGNLGLGVTPSAWYSGSKAIQIGASTSLSDLGGSYTLLGQNYKTGTSGNDIYINNGYASLYSQNGGAHRWYTAPSGTAGNAISFTQAMTLDASGNQLLGATSQSVLGERLLVNGAGIVVQSAAATNRGMLGNFGGSDFIVGSYDSIALAFRTGNTERARIDSSGNLLIGGTSGTDYKLRVDRSDNNGLLTLRNSLSSGVTYDQFQVIVGQAASSGYMFARFYAGNGGSPQFAFRGDGQLLATSTSIASISDVRVKENIRDSNDGLQTILGLRPVRFDFKEGFGNNRKNQLGFIAQEVEGVFQDAVDVAGSTADDGDAHKSVAPGTLIPVLVKAIQEQQAIINAQQAALEQLKARLDAANL